MGAGWRMCECMGRALTLSVQQQQPSIQPCTAQLSPDRCRKATVHTERAIGRDNTSAVYLKQLTSPPCGANQSEKKKNTPKQQGEGKGGERESNLFVRCSPRNAEQTRKSVPVRKPELRFRSMWAAQPQSLCPLFKPPELGGWDSFTAAAQAARCSATSLDQSGAN